MGKIYEQFRIMPVTSRVFLFTWQQHVRTATSWWVRPSAKNVCK